MESNNKLTCLFSKTPVASDQAAEALCSGYKPGTIMTQFPVGERQERKLTLYTNNFKVELDPKVKLVKFNVTILPEVDSQSKLFGSFFKNAQLIGFLNSIFGETWMRLKTNLFCLSSNLKMDQISEHISFNLA